MPKLTLIVLLALIVLLPAAALPAAGQTAEPAQVNTLYLPLLNVGIPSNGIFGLETTRVLPSRGLGELVDLSPTWVRRNGLLWSQVEPVPGGGYRWDSQAIRTLEAELILASQRGFKVVLIVRSSPDWAVAPHTVDCAPIAPQHYGAFANFLRAAVERYSQPPYNVKYWEIGNEPDATIAGADLPYGCWGDPNDPYYGGRAYGEALKQAYPAIKAANPGVQVLNGGLLLDQPFNPADPNTVAGRFLEGMLEAGAGNSFDILSFHSYSFYNGDTDGVLGPVDWKPGYLRGLLSRYGLTKPLFNTEGALLCIAFSNECAQQQAYYIPRLYARSIRDGLIGTVWFIYDSDGFNYTALISPSNFSKRPAYRAYDKASSALGGATYEGPIAGLPADVEGYRFTRGRETILILWAKTVTRRVSLNLGPVTGLACSGWDGSALPCSVSGGGLVLDAQTAPRYISYTTP